MSWETKQQKCKTCRYWEGLSTFVNAFGDCHRNVVLRERQGTKPACQWWDRNPDLARKRKVAK